MVEVSEGWRWLEGRHSLRGENDVVRDTRYEGNRTTLLLITVILKRLQITFRELVVSSQRINNSS